MPAERKLTLMDENRNKDLNNTDLSIDILRKRKEAQASPQRPAPANPQSGAPRRPAPQGQPQMRPAPTQRPAMREGQAPQRPQPQAGVQRRVPDNCPKRAAAGQTMQKGQPLGRPAPQRQTQARPAQPQAQARPAPINEARKPAPRPDPIEKNPAEDLKVKAAPIASAAEPVIAPSPAPAPTPTPAPKVAPYQQRRMAATHAQVSPAVQSTVVASKVADPKSILQENSKDNKKEKSPVTDKHKNAKAGADMMVGIVKAMAYMAVILVVSVFISIFVIRVGNDVFAFVKSDEAVDVTIPENADIGDIAEILSDNGIINFPGIFKMYAGIKKDSGEFIAGDYTISPSMSYDDLRHAFKKQAVTGTAWITIPEGYSIDEIIDLMVENGIGERERYIDVINNYDFDYWFIDELEKNPPKDGRAYRLEGYLFPDTYEFYKASSEEMVVDKLLARFDEVFVEDYRTKAAELGYTVDEVLTIASLVEKEAGRASDFMYVSSVFHNRLNNPATYPRLESDATTVYAIQIATGTRPDKVTPEDNKFEHPYNTYLNAGLMPGPITNPSASAIRYALYPANTSYYYFITDNNGKVYYASGIAEHNQNIELVKQVNSQAD